MNRNGRPLWAGTGGASMCLETSFSRGNASGGAPPTPGSEENIKRA